VQTIPTVDLYRQLEVDPAASVETIDAAWKSLLKRHHPDVTADAGAAHERVKRLNLAHEWLSDPERRALYDRSRRRPGVVVVPRVPNSPAGRPRPAPAAPPAGGGRSTSGAQTAGAGAPPHNPYAEYDRSSRPSAPAPPAMSGVARRSRRRLPPLLIPVAVLSVLAVVAVSSFVAAMRPGPGSASASATPSGSATAVASSPRRGAAASGIPELRGLPPPDLKADLPAGCSPVNLARPFTFETTVAGAPAKVYVVRCKNGRSAGPLVYVASAAEWELAGRLGSHAGVPWTAVSGAITGRAPDEFGIAWTGDAGATTTLTLYQASKGLSAFWNSESIGLAWSLPKFTWEGGADPLAPGRLVVVSADLGTGTPNCASCPDHQLYREVYAWDTSGPTPRLRAQSPRESAGAGSP